MILAVENLAAVVEGSRWWGKLRAANELLLIERAKDWLLVGNDK